MAGDGNFRWYYAAFEDAETWSKGGATREETIAIATADYNGDFEEFWIFEADQSVVEPNFRVETIAEGIIEDLIECNEECWGEDGADDAWSSEDCAALAQAVEIAVSVWLRTHPGKTSTAGNVRVAERIALAAAEASE